MTAAEIRRSRPGTRVAFLLSLALLILVRTPGDAQSLLGSSTSLDRQNAQARAHSYTYLRTPDQVTGFVRSGYLVPVAPTREMDLHQVSFPYTRPQVLVFIQRLASQYHDACGEKLVVTSLTRPTSNQPVNASSRSVHPTGMAVDLRRSSRVACREWLESTLLALENEGVLEATRERNPPHYHLAVFPEPYSGYLAAITDDPGIGETLAAAASADVRWVQHVVQRGETLTSIAGRYGSSVNRLRVENGLRSDRLLVGQRLQVPTIERGPASSVRAAADDAESGSRESASFAVTASETVETASSEQTSEPALHTVARGESLWLIARRYDVDETELRRANGLSGNRIYVGQELAIPGAYAPERRGENLIHTVARGESLWTISQTYGVAEEIIRAANGIRGSRILVGQRISIPAPGGAGVLEHKVARGESLWTIANRHGTTVEEIRRTNGMETSRIYAGQILEVPLTF